MGLSERQWKKHSLQLSRKILDLRAERGWSQEALAEAAGISRSLVQFLETGRKSRATGSQQGQRVPFNPTIKTLYSVAAAFGVTIHELLAEE